MRNYFVFNGRDSRDFGVYISGQGTFSAPQKAYQFYNIPGRNGALIGYDNRFENINVSYDAFIYKDFDKNIAEFRSFLLSVPGYARLEDSYHPDEYRVAAYVGPFEPTITSKNDAGSFTITFNCKPQRYLLSGETQYAWGSGVLTATGKNFRLYGPNIDDTSLTLNMPLLRAGSGTPSPRNPRPITLYDGAVIKIDGTEVYNRTFTSAQQCAAGTINAVTGAFTKTWQIRRVTSHTWTEVIYPHHFTWSGFMSGVKAATAICSHMSAYAPDPLTPPFPYYDLAFQINNGDLEIYSKSSKFDTQAELNAYLDANEVYIAAELSTPTSYTLDPYTPTYPAGWCDISSNVEMTISYLDAIELINPTPFASKPIIRVYGDGAFTMNDVTVTITGGGTYTDIDCEMMDCYEGTTNRNQNVSFSTYDFPELKPGENTVIGSTIGTLYIKPRWWRL